MLEIENINESHLHLKNCELDLALNISEKFSFYAENYKFAPKYRSGTWDGKIRLFNKRKNLLPIGLEVDLLSYLNQNRIKFKNKIEKYKEINLSVEFINKFCNKLLKCDHELRDYQIAAIQQTLKYRKLILLSATGSGKSYILFIILNLLKYIDDDFKSLLVVPGSGLVEQMRDDFREYGENFCEYDKYIHRIYGGKEKETDKPVVISNWQSIMRLPSSYFAKYDCVIADECHGATAKQLSQIITNCSRASFKIGTTGSLKDTTMSKMLLKSLFSRVYTASKTKDLQKRKILAQLKIRNCILNYPESHKENCKKLNYVDEIDFIKNIDSRKKFICNLVKKATGNTLVLFRYIDYGKAIFEMLKKTNDRTYFIFGETAVEIREQVRKIAEKYDNVIIVASYRIFSQGVNIKRLHNLVFAESTKSIIRVVQSIGRTLRMHETKETAILYDIVDNLQWKSRKNYTLKHFFSRVKIYDSERFNYKTKTFKIG